MIQKYHGLRSGATPAAALLLDESAYLRFASTGPDGVTATLTFYAWDQTDGNSSEGTADVTATLTPASTDYFSADSNSLSLVVTDLNDSPERQMVLLLIWGLSQKTMHHQRTHRRIVV